MSSSKDAQIIEKFKKVTALNYADQAKFFLNAFWNEVGANEAENVWKYCNMFCELDQQKKKNGSDLDEFSAHRFLEMNGETKRVVELRETLRSLDYDFNKRMALVEYLLFHYNQSIRELVTRPQGENKEEMEEAQKMVEEAQKQVNVAQSTAEAAAQAAAAAKKSEEESELKAKEAQAAEAEVKAALSDVKNQEEAFNKKTEELKAKSTQGSTVQQAKAKAELAQHLQSDPLPLRKAKTTLEAANRKAEKARVAAETAYQKSAEAAAKAAESAKKAEENANEAMRKLEEASQKLEEVKKRPGRSEGALWWMDRELKEAQKYLPSKKVPKK